MKIIPKISPYREKLAFADLSRTYMDDIIFMCSIYIEVSLYMFMKYLIVRTNRVLKRSLQRVVADINHYQGGRAMEIVFSLVL